VTTTVTFPCELVFNESKGQILLVAQPQPGLITGVELTLATSKQAAQQFAERLNRLAELLPEEQDAQG
jgi:hypothetical protein